MLRRGGAGSRRGGRERRRRSGSFLTTGVRYSLSRRGPHARTNIRTLARAHALMRHPAPCQRREWLQRRGVRCDSVSTFVHYAGFCCVVRGGFRPISFAAYLVRSPPSPPPPVLTGHVSSLPPVLTGHVSSLPPVLTGHVSYLVRLARPPLFNAEPWAPRARRHGILSSAERPRAPRATRRRARTRSPAHTCSPTSAGSSSSAGST
jgi:hypothetical protein